MELKLKNAIFRTVLYGTFNRTAYGIETPFSLK